MKEKTMTDREIASQFEVWNGQIGEPDKAAEKRAQERWDAVAKPLDGLGRFERIIKRIAGMTGDDKICLSPAALIIMCADNGIIEEGVSQSGAEVTAAVAKSMAQGRSSACRMAAAAGVDVIPVDIGIKEAMEESGREPSGETAGREQTQEALAGTEPSEEAGGGRRERSFGNLLGRRIRNGTRNFLKEPALTAEETLAAIRTGIDLAKDCRGRGYRILLTGEMGIGNTTTSAALTAALLGCRGAEVCGRGAGLDDAGLARKTEVVEKGLLRYGYGTESVTDAREVFRALCSFGGLDIAGLAGVFIGGAMSRIPVVIDGVISAAAALIARRLVPACAAYQLASHAGREKACRLLEASMGLEPLIDADLALGEGTGAVLLMPLLNTVLPVYRSETDFSKLRMEPYVRYPAKEKLPDADGKDPGEKRG